MAVDIRKLPHLSASRIQTLGRCGEQYRRRYECGDIARPGLALVRGRSVHKGRATHMRHKLVSDELMAPEAVCQAVTDDLDVVLADGMEGLLLTSEQKAMGMDRIRGDLHDGSRRLALLDYHTFGLHTTPAEVEVELAVQPKGFPVPLIGYVDLIDSDGWIDDLKTTSKSPPKGEADSSSQLTMYSLLRRANRPGIEAGLRLQYLVDLKKTPKVVVQETTRDRDDYEAWVNRVGTALEVIEAGIFIPANRNAWWCDPRYCGYWSTCPYVNGKRRPTS